MFYRSIAKAAKSSITAPSPSPEPGPSHRGLPYFGADHVQLGLPELEDRAGVEALLGPAEQGLGAGEVFVGDGFAQVGLPQIHWNPLGTGN